MGLENKGRVVGGVIGGFLALVVISVLLTAAMPATQAVQEDGDAPHSGVERRIGRETQETEKPELSIAEITALLPYSTYFGENTGEHWIYDVAVDVNGSVYACGKANTDPGYGGAPGWNQTIAGGYDAFLVKFTSDLSSVEYFTYFGGSLDDAAHGVAVNGSGCAVITGTCGGADVPHTHPNYPIGSYDAFCAMFTPDGTELVYAFRFGSAPGDEVGLDVQLDEYDSPHIVGYTSNGAEMLITTNANMTVSSGNQDAFYTRLLPNGYLINGTDACWSTLISGSGWDVANATTVGRNNVSYVVGSTSSSDFPATFGAYNRTYGGNKDAYVSRYELVGGVLVQDTTFLGNWDVDGGQSIDHDNNTDTVVACGFTFSIGFPTTAGAFNQTASDQGNKMGWVAKLPSDLSTLNWSTLISTRFDANLRDVDVGSNESWVYLTGSHDCGDGGYSQSGYPVTPDATWSGGQQDSLILTIMSENGSDLVYSTLCRGAEPDYGSAVALQGNSSRVVTVGTTYTSASGLDREFPVTSGAFDTTIGRFHEGFVTGWDVNLTGPFVWLAGDQSLRNERTEGWYVNALAVGKPDTSIDEVWVVMPWDNYSMTQYGDENNWSASVDLTSAQGHSHVVFDLYARDSVGDEASSLGHVLYVGGVPGINRINYTSDLGEDGLFVATCNSTDDISGVDEVWLYLDGVSHLMTWTMENGWYVGDIPMNETGEYQFFIRSTDKSGQRKTSSNYSLTVTPREKPTTAVRGPEAEGLPPVVPSFVWYVITAAVGAVVVLLAALGEKVPLLKDKGVIVAGGLLFVLSFAMTSYARASEPLTAVRIGTDREGNPVTEDRSTAWPVLTVFLVTLSIAGWAVLAYYLKRTGLTAGGLAVFGVLTLLSFAAITPAQLFTTEALFFWSMLGFTLSFACLLVSGWMLEEPLVIAAIILAGVAGGLLAWFSVVQAINWVQGAEAVLPTVNGTGGVLT